ncbi:non-ribosomal peptide synthase/polyketide synthase [Pseudomonas sp. ZM23]|uniref:Non-ribosomal peptide synthase/polyketide synthase n=1 Tax=Pseudomonas triclosanedens TaxID=2961893 RepID=A0ABY7A559_9PSED|nr:non-ribosomal peptide synthase/polyketide synthase [Pseudomonas triclosanedens]MCP8466331.1 non-ribosomal peptide synthase/polyketide synthase [Pseudomonas triclosanedens]MCP8471857.1 non-ribosomal peptide synthase/polyketide synthase [Pseudomonas triclosanedens]MCP8478552.1 non-ribosomal peptide synthase/polyketide synthase [Pseudomonas triclosanedens]WAI52253.1 non-ribosomal peptide synthase/polyketide synthase [Pseudomonas triclosanedens]
MNDRYEAAGNLVEALLQRASEMPRKTALRFIAEGVEESVGFRELDERARALAVWMLRHGRQGDRAVLLLPSGPDYVAAFFACLYAGIIAVPAYPPESVRPQHLARLRSILADAEPSLVLTDSSLIEALRPACARDNGGSPLLLAVDQADPALAVEWQMPELAADDIAFLQYTSGSTSTPKGVQVSHGNLVANERLIRHGFGIGDDDVIVSWLPLFHDMGLIGGLLQPIYSGIECVLMSPRYFLERPRRWLEAIARFGGTISGGPDFAYRLCCERVNESALEGLDLSCWRLAFSGSEPIRQDTLERFAAWFAPARFDASAFYACYGLAEATLFVTGGVRGEGIGQLEVDLDALGENIARPGRGTALINCGRAQPDHDIRLVDPLSGETLGPDRVGEIWSSGPSVALGYWRNPEASARTFVQKDGHTWLRTGDLGFLHNDELFVTGRLKDMLIVRGQNLYPQDLERCVEEEVDLVRKGRVSAFAIEHQGREGIGIAAEVGRSVRKLVSAEALAKAISTAVAEAFQEAPLVVALLEPGALPKTSSGKLQRSACRAQLLDGSIQAYAIQRAGEPISDGASARPVAPLTAQEQAIAALWSEVLELPAIRRDDNFFALGGNSIKATQLMARLRERMGQAVELRLLFEAPELGAFAAALAALHVSETQAVPQVSRAGLLPLSPAQRRLWFLWKLAPESAVYHIAGRMILRGELRRPAVEQAFTQLLGRHETLRSRFVEQADGEVALSLADDSQVELSESDFSSLGNARRDVAVREDAERFAAQPFDLATGPLLRLRLQNLGGGRQALLLCVHHIVADGWSLNLLLDEFAECYRAIVEQREPVLPTLPRQYLDLAVAQRNALEAGEGARLLQWWRERLGSEHAPLELPFGLPETKAGEHGLRAALIELDVDAELTGRLRQLAQAHGATLPMLLLGAYNLLLQRYSGQHDLRIGLTQAGREQLDSERLVGFFVNLLVLRSELPEGASLRGVLRQLRDDLLQAQAHQGLPFEQLVEALQPERAHGRHPLCQVAFDHQWQPLAGNGLPGVSVEALQQLDLETPFDLVLRVREGEQSLRLSFCYARERYAETGMQRLAGHFLDLLRALPRLDADAVLDARDWLPTSDWRIAVAGDAPAFEALSETITAQARRHPAKVALIDEQREVTFAELEDRSNRLAQRLVQLGIGPERRVAVALPRGVDIPLALLAVLKAGGAYLPLDVDYPAERLAWLMQDAGVELLLTNAALAETLPLPAGVERLVLEEADLGNAPAVRPLLRIQPQNLAYLIYTSGSTGQPKGVAVAHGEIAAHCHAIGQRYAMSAADRELIFMSFAFDGAHERWLTALSHGGSLLIRNDALWTAEQTLGQLRRHEVTVAAFPPAYLQQLAEQALEHGHVPSMRIYCFGGDAVAESAYQLAHRALKPEHLINGYGPTETVVTPLLWKADARTACGAAYAPIGEVVGERSLYILDDRLQPLPRGVAGELYIGGHGLARGYHQRAGMTAERFVADPCADGLRLYRSGDRVRWREDGALDYLGRIDQQVKIRGFRIEPGEIEARLRALPGVREAAVIARDSERGKRLLGYASGESLVEEALKAALRAQLPDYMVPWRILVLDEMPLNANGKIDRKALPEPQETSSTAEAPRDGLESSIAAVWTDVLGVPGVGREDDFFDLGGHSLLATQVVSRLRRDLGCDVPLRDLFEASRLHEFAARVGNLAPGTRPSLRAVARDGDLPLSAAQSRLWFFWRMEPASAAYNVPGALRLRGPLDEAALRRAFDTLVARHETLRTTFGEVDGQAFQRIQPAQALDLARVDLSAESDAEAAARQLAETEAQRPFDLRNGPLLRLILLKLADADHVLLLTMHHIVSDGWSIRVLVDEFSRLYGAFAVGEELELPKLPVQYADYAQWQRELLAGDEGQRQLSWWTGLLGNATPVLELAADRPRPAVQSYRGGSLGFSLDAGLGRRLKRLAREQDVTLFMLLLAAYAVLMQRYSGQRDLRIAVPIANRQQLETEGLIGFFVNTQVMPCRVADDESFAALLARLKPVALGAQANQDLPFEQLVEALQPERSLAHNPLVQVKFNFGFDVSRLPDAGALKLELFSEEQYGARFDLALDMAEALDASGQPGDELRGSFVYARDLFDEDSVAAIAGQFEALLRQLCAEPQRALGELPCPLASRRRGEARQWPQQTVLGLFATQVAGQPDAIAVQDDGVRYSYAELDRRANRLASLLIENGVKPGECVAICQERGAQWVLLLLGVLKAGATCVPLDPAQPAERLRQLLRDSGICRVLVSDAGLLETFGAAATRVPAGGPEQGSDAAPALHIDPQQAAYVIFTSGSTGQPKGVRVSHAALANYVQAVLKRLQLDQGRAKGLGMAVVSSVAADLGYTTLFGALCGGARLHLADAGTVADAERFAAFMRNVDVLKIVPGHLAGLLAAAPDAAAVLPRRLLVLGGEACGHALLQPIRELSPTLRIVNHYGPSETTVGVLTHEWALHDDLPAGSLPIGTPLANTAIRVLDENGRDLLPGVPGELYIGGAGLALDYLGLPEMTAERFVEIEGERLYRSGDRVRLNRRGEVEFLGRIDDQVKIRGYRVEPGELAQALKRLPGVRDAVALAERENDGPQRLMAWAVADGRSVESLREELAIELPEYLMPAQLILLERLPLNANGKVDRHALPRAETAAKPAESEPLSELEQRIADIWQAVLKVEHVGAQDNFFELGGDSILSLQIIARIRKLGYKLSPRQLFERQTVRQLAQWLESRAPAAATAPAPVATVSGEVALSPVQARFFERVPSGQRHHWNQALLLQPREPLDVDALARALHWLVGQHDALRLRFDDSGQRYADHGPLDMTLLWRRRASGMRTLERLCDDAQASLDIVNGPLLRAMHVSLEHGGERLLLLIHHLAVDGVSWRILLEDLQYAYRELHAGRIPAALPRSDSYQAWSARQQKAASSTDVVAELDYWQAELSDAPSLNRGHRGAPATWKEAAHARFSLDAETTRQLLGPAPKAQGIQVNDLLLTALARALCAWSGESCALIEMEGHGRDAFDNAAVLDLSRSVGWFTALYPVRLQAGGEPGADLRATREHLRDLPRAGIGYGLLRYLSTHAESLRDLPAPYVTFNYLGQLDQAFADADFLPVFEGVGRTQPRDAALGNALVYTGRVLGSELSLEVTYSNAMFDAADIDELQALLRAELQALVAWCLNTPRRLEAADLPLLQLEQTQLDALPLPAGVEDLYPLSPMQQGMLFHALDVPGSPLYVNQLRVDLDGLDEARLLAAWQAVIARHANLRTGFLANAGSAPLQFVLRDVQLPVQSIDWRGRPVDEQSLDGIADGQRGLGFDLATPPLQRLALVRLGERRYHLIWTCHHLLLDGWSSARLIGEVLALYRGETLPPPVVQYADYIGWLHAQDGAAGETFWRERLKGFDEPTLLSTACAAGFLQEAPRELYSRLAAAPLQRFAQSQRITLNTLVQGAWALLLQRYCGQRSVTFGATVAGRPATLPGAEESLGLFINTLPILQSPDDAQHIGDWLRELQAFNLDVREFEHTPLYDIQRWAGRGGQALFDTLIVFENFPMDAALSSSGGDLRILGHRPVDGTNYALALVVSAGEQLDVRYTFRADRLSASQIELLRGHFEHLLLTLVEDAERPLGRVSQLADAERNQLLQRFNDTEAAFPADMQLQALIERQVTATPEVLALQFGELRLSYAQLNARANQLAHWLRDQGVGPEVLVGVAAERSVELVVALLGIVKSGGAYVPMDPDYPQERLQHMLADSGVRLLLTQQHLLQRLPASNAEMVCLDSQWGEIATASEQNPAILGSPQNLAYLIYTSGSTGKPKGAGNSHRALVNRLHWMQKAYALDGADRVLQKTPFSFDVSVWEFFWPLLAGATLVVAAPGAHRDPAALRQVIEAEQVTTLHFVPSMLQAFVASGELERCPSLRQVMCSGEALPYALQQQFRQRSSAKLNNLYGPTEAAIDVSFWACDEDNARQVVPIGRPIDNLRLVLLDERLEPVPQGMAGELYIGGVGLARGYHARPGLTAACFVADPFGSGERLYRTGDLARQREDGAIEYLGRLDQQVKIRGLRIELGEIEARLQAHPQVSEAVVVARDGVLLAYVVASAEPEALRQVLQGELPDYMVPARIIALDAMPLSPNGKLDRKALPTPQFSGSARQYVAPRSDLEVELAGIWQQVLQVDRVGLHDDFFELGGHSLLLTQVGLTLRQRLGLELPLHRLFELSNIAAQAAWIEAQRASSASAEEELDLMDELLGELENL